MITVPATTASAAAPATSTTPSTTAAPATCTSAANAAPATTTTPTTNTPAITDTPAITASPATATNTPASPATATNTPATTASPATATNTPATTASPATATNTPATTTAGSGLGPFLLIKPAVGRLGLALLTGAVAAGAAIALTAVSAWLISRAALHPPVLHLMVAIVAVRACGLSRGVLRYLERLFGHDAAFRILADVRVRLFERLERLAPAGLADFRHADLARRLASDVDAVLDLVTRVLLPYAVASVVGLASVLVVGSLVPAAGLVLALALLVAGAGVPWLQRAAARRADGRLAPLRAELSTGVVDLLHGLPDLIAYGAAHDRLDRLADVDARLTVASRRSAATAGLGAAVTALTTGVSVLAGLVAGAYAVRSGALHGELLALVVLTPLAVFEIAGPLPAAAQHYTAARASLHRLAEIWRAPDPLQTSRSASIAASTRREQIPDPARQPEPNLTTTPNPKQQPNPAEQPKPNPTTTPNPKQGPSPAGSGGVPVLRVEGVTAGWVEGRTAVSGFDLVLPAGGRVALTGPSGSGKSTVAALLVRFLDPRAGRVTMDGIDLRDLPADEVRAVVGYLPEDAYLFDTTIGANLRIGRPDATDAELRAALGAARLLDWTETLPDGLGTLVGEHGMALSGGQRRRLALARLLLTDARVLILDEPTEHLDDATAAALTRDLVAAAGERTVLLITHRTDLDGLTVVSMDTSDAAE